MKKNKVSVGVAVAGICLVALFGVGFAVKSFSGGSPKVVVEGNMTFNEATQSDSGETIGAAPGPFHTERQFFQAGFQSGGEVYSTSSKKSTYTLLESEIDEDTVFIDWTPINDITLTTMASSSMYWLGENIGDTRTFYLNNSATTTGKEITIAAGTGVLLQVSASSTAAGTGIAPIAYASSTLEMRFMRIPYNNKYGAAGSGSATTTANVLLLIDTFFPTY